MILYKLLAGLFKGIRFIMPKPGSVLKAIGFIVVVLGFILNYLILKPNFIMCKHPKHYLFLATRREYQKHPIGKTNWVFLCLYFMLFLYCNKLNRNKIYVFLPQNNFQIKKLFPWRNGIPLSTRYIYFT